MKKLLSLIVLGLFMMTGLAWAQGTLNFDEVDSSNKTLWNLPTGSNYGDGSVEVDGITWEYGHSQASGSYSIDNQGLLLRRASDGYLEATIPNGIGNFSFDYRKAYTGATNRNLELIVDGIQVTTTGNFGGGSGAQTTVYNLSHDIDKEGSVTVRIKLVGTATSNAHVVIDNIVWTGYEASDPNQPALDVLPTSLSGFGYEVGNPESQSQQFRVLSVNIDKNIVITAPDNYQLSLNSIFNNPQSVINARINDGSGTFYVRLEPGLPVGPYNGNITVAPENPVDGISTVNVSLSGEVTEVIPEVTLDKTSLSGFTYTENHGPSEDMSFTVKGKGIQTHIAVTLGSGNNSPFELRIEDEQNYESDLTLQNVETYTIDTKIYVRLKEGLSTGPHSDTIGFTCSDVSGSIPSIALSGVVYRDIGPDDYFVHFDDNTKIGYASGEVILSGKEWNMTEALTCTSKLIDGTNSARLSGRTGSKIEMNEPIDSGIGKISFEYRAWASDEQAEWVVQYKTTSSDWLEIGTFEATKDDNNVYLFEKTVDVSGEILIRVIVSRGLLMPLNVSI